MTSRVAAPTEEWMRMGVRFHLLGPVRAEVDGRRVAIGHARRQCVLVNLLLDVNSCVSVEQLIDRVWGEHRLPQRPRNALQTYVSGLRRELGAGAGVTIARQAAGYVIRTDPATVDLYQFRALVDAARTGADPTDAAMLERALGEWQGEAFAGLDTPWLNLVRDTVERERYAARMTLTDIQLRLGRHAALLPRLADWTNEHGRDERLAGQFMLALYRDGDPAKALAHYQRFRRRVVDELGADPGPALKRLHQQILNADPALDVPAPVAAPAVARGPVPRQLPAPSRLFAGRARELAALDAGGAVRAIEGIGGVGKTWLALHWAHRHLDRFPDGQLYVNLHGFEPSGEPTSADTVLHRFLDALGVPGDEVPLAVTAKAALFRSLTAGRRMLVMLDNARDPAQVEPLLPASPSCVALVTSRGRMAKLVATHGAVSIPLDVLPDADAMALLRVRLGADRLAAEPAAVTTILSCCAGLPLAIGIVAARASTHPTFPLSALADELREASARLDALDGGELTANVRTVLSGSYDALDADAAAVFELLGLVPGPDIDTAAAASLAGRSPDRTRAALRTLEDIRLIQQHAPGRYRMHDLVGLYAADKARRTPAAALRPLVDFYAHTALTGERQLDPHRATITLDPPTAGCRPLELTDEATALAWFDAEHDCLLAAQRAAVTHGWHDLVWQLAWTMDTFHIRRGRLNDHIATWERGLAATGHIGDPGTEADAHRRLGHAYARGGRNADAVTHLRRALNLAEAAGDTHRAAHTHRALAIAMAEDGDDRQALVHSTWALELLRRAGAGPMWEANSLNTIGWFHAQLGEYPEARAACEAALALYREHRADRDGEAHTLDSLGYIAQHTGRHAEALDYYERTLAGYRELGNSYEEASTLDRLGQTHSALGRPDAARRAWRQAERLYRSQGRDADADNARERAALEP